MELQEKPVVDKMNKINTLTFCVFTILLVFTVLQPAFAVSTNNKTKVSNTTSLSINSTAHKSVKPVHPKNVPSKDTCPCIVFRLDDVQEFYLSDVQMKIMDVFQKKNASLSIGIIGYNLPLDAKLVSYLKNDLKSGHGHLEIANHGWKHEDFASLSLSQQVSLMNKTNQELTKVFGKKPSVFITPFNLYDNDTLKAVKQLKMSLISSGIWEEDKFVTTKGKIVANKDLLGLYHVPSMTDYQVDIGNESYWTSIPKDKILASIDSHVSKYGYDVLLLHPQNFAVIVNGQYANTAEKSSLDELASIIDYAKSKHLKIVTLSDIAGLDHVNAKPVIKTSKTLPVSKSIPKPISKPVTVSKSVTPSTKPVNTVPVPMPAPVVNISKFLEATQPSKVVAHVEQNGSLTMNIKYPNGDRVGAYDTSLKIYQDSNLVPYEELKSISGNPYTIESLPLYHQYKIETYVGGMLSSTNLVTHDSPEQDLDVNIPDGGSMVVSVYYNDGETPIPGTSVSVVSQDNKTRDTGVTDPDGVVSRFYLPATNEIENYYVVNAKINSHMTFSSTHMTLQSGDANDVRLIAPWPPIIQSLVTVKVYNQTKLLSSYGQPYVVDLYDDKGNKIVESPLNIHGEGYFWSMKAGDYVFKVVNTASGEVLGNLVATLDGTKNNFDMVIQKHVIT